MPILGMTTRDGAGAATARFLRRWKLERRNGGEIIPISKHYIVDYESALWVCVHIMCTTPITGETESVVWHDSSELFN
jgi:hypothetical protein